MKGRWALQQAKRSLGTVVDSALMEGPQIITRNGVEVAVVLSLKEYRKLQSRGVSLFEFFRSSPLFGSELDLTRDTSPPRDELKHLE